MMTPGEAAMADYLLIVMGVLAVGAVGGVLAALVVLKLRDRALRKAWRHTSPASWGRLRGFD
jgi:hypothetical protein